MIRLIAAMALAVSSPHLAIKRASEQTGVPYKLLHAICKVESNLDPRAIHHDDGGSDSIGLCQIKEETARWMGFTGPKEDLLKPDVNALYSARYVKKLLLIYLKRDILVIAAYNSGTPKFRNGELVNQAYVDKVMEVLSERTRRDSNRLEGAEDFSRRRGSCVRDHCDTRKGH